ncbi:MAG: helix-turn-helix domain-containing protein [Chthoniobacterales bacterium]
MEGLGEKLQKARVARNLTLDEAARMTKIRPAKLADIESEDFSQFPSLAYAKGFLLIYGKFLNVDVTPYLEAFETSEHVTVDGYSYLQDNPAPKPRRAEVIRAAPSNRTSLLPLVIGLVILIAGFSLMKLIMDIKRIKPSSTERDAQALAQASTAPGVAISPGQIAAPRALAADATPAPTPPTVTAMATVSPIPASSAPAVSQPTVAAVPEASDAEPEVRRAEPVNPQDLVKAQAALASPGSSPSPGGNRFEIRPLKKTFVRIVVDNAGGPSLQRWVDVSEAPMQFRGQRIAVKVLNPSDVEIRKNGKIVARGDADVRLE